MKTILFINWIWEYIIKTIFPNFLKSLIWFVFLWLIITIFILIVTFLIHFAKKFCYWFKRKNILKEKLYEEKFTYSYNSQHPIIDLINENKSILIIAEQGAGKSYFISELIKYYSKYKANYEFLSIKAWEYVDDKPEQLIIKKLFNSNSITLWSRLRLSRLVFRIKWKGLFSKLTYDYQVDFYRIINKLKIKKDKIIVWVIDELDRCHTNKIIDFLEFFTTILNIDNIKTLTKQTLSSENCKIIYSFDKNIVEGKLKVVMGKNSFVSNDAEKQELQDSDLQKTSNNRFDRWPGSHLQNTSNNRFWYKYINVEFKLPPISWGDVLLKTKWKLKIPKLFGPQDSLFFTKHNPRIVINDINTKSNQYFYNRIKEKKWPDAIIWFCLLLDNKKNKFISDTFWNFDKRIDQLFDPKHWSYISEDKINNNLGEKDLIIFMKEAKQAFEISRDNMYKFEPAFEKLKPPSHENMSSLLEAREINMNLFKNHVEEILIKKQKLNSLNHKDYVNYNAEIGILILKEFFWDYKSHKKNNIPSSSDFDDVIKSWNPLLLGENDVKKLDNYIKNYEMPIINIILRNIYENKEVLLNLNIEDKRIHEIIFNLVFPKAKLELKNIIEAYSVTIIIKNVLNKVKMN